MYLARGMLGWEGVTEEKEDDHDSIRNDLGTINADLIVMGTRGLAGLKHAMLGSVAERVVRLAPCPVLTVKHPEAD